MKWSGWLVTVADIIISVTGDSVLVNWLSQAGSHSCSFDIDWLRKHDYTTPSVHKQRIQDETPLIAVCNIIIFDHVQYFVFYINRNHYQLQIIKK